MFQQKERRKHEYICLLVLFPSSTLKHIELHWIKQSCAIINHNTYRQCLVTWVFTLWKDVLSRSSCIQPKSDFLPTANWIQWRLSRFKYGNLVVTTTWLEQTDIQSFTYFKNPVNRARFLWPIGDRINEIPPYLPLVSYSQNDLLNFWFFKLIDRKICPILTTAGMLTSRNVVFLRNSLSQFPRLHGNYACLSAVIKSVVVLIFKKVFIMYCWFFAQGLSQDPNSLSNLDQVGCNSPI